MEGSSGAKIYSCHLDGASGRALRGLERKKFEDMGKKQVERFVRQIIRISVITPVKSSYKVVREDPEDDVVINTAYAGRAKYIVTGDSHLLKIAAFKGIKIVSIGSFLEML